MAKRSGRKGQESGSGYYSDDMTKEVVGRLFEQYTADDGKNYFAPSGRRAARAEEEAAKKEEDKKGFFEENDEEESFEEEKHESGFARFVRKAKQAILPPDDDDDEEDDEEASDDVFEEEDSDDGMLDFPDPDAEEKIITEQQTVVPKRKERTKNNQPLVIEENGSSEEEENIFDIPETLEEKKPEPRRMTRREKMEQRVEAKRRRRQPDPEPETESGQTPFEEEYFEDEETEVIEIPVGRVALIVIIVIVALLILTLFGKCISYGSQLKEAKKTVEQLENANTSSTYEKELEELKAKNEELTQQLESIQQASAVVSPSDSTGNSSTDTSTSTSTGDDVQGLSQQQSDSGSYELVEYDGQSLYDFAESYYGDGSRYKDILKANNISLEDLEDGTVTVGTKLKMPQ